MDASISIYQRASRNPQPIDVCHLLTSSARFQFHAVLFDFVKWANSGSGTRNRVCLHGPLFLSLSLSLSHAINPIQPARRPAPPTDLECRQKATAAAAASAAVHDGGGGDGAVKAAPLTALPGGALSLSLSLSPLAASTDFIIYPSKP